MPASVGTGWWEPPTLAAGRELWVAGTSGYQNELRAISGGSGPFGARVPVHTAHLVESSSPGAGTVVQVVVAGRIIGVLDEDTAAKCRRALDRLQSDGQPASCRILLIGGADRGRGQANKFSAKLLLKTPVSLALREPFIPPGLRHEVELAPGIAEYLRTEAAGVKRSSVLVTLRPAGRRVTVEHDGRVLGTADRPARGEAPYLPALVQTLAAADKPTTCRAYIIAPADSQGSHRLDVMALNCMPVIDRAAENTAKLNDQARWELQGRPQTGRWQCSRCGSQWQNRQRAPEEWWRHKTGPHVCPNGTCASFAFTYPR